MTKILVNTRSLKSPLSGVQRYTREIILRLENRVICTSPDKFSRGFFGHLWEQTTLPILSKNHLLFSPSNTGPLLVKNQVVSLMDVTTLDHPEWFNPYFASWYQFLLPKLVNRAQKIITISNYSKDRIVETCGINPEKIIVTYLAADPRFSPKSNQDISLVRKELGIPTNHYILALGSLEPRKNLQRLLVAWSSIQYQMPDDISLVIAGAKGKDTIFREISMDNLPSGVYLTGFVSDLILPTLIAGAMAFLYPSLYEGFGLPPLEAMACGVPVITSNTTSLPEVTGDAALLVNPFDTDAIAGGILRLVNDISFREQLAFKGLERAQKFTWQTTTEKTWQVLQQVAREI